MQNERQVGEELQLKKQATEPQAKERDAADESKGRDASEVRAGRGMTGNGIRHQASAGLQVSKSQILEPREFESKWASALLPKWPEMTGATAQCSAGGAPTLRLDANTDRPSFNSETSFNTNNT